MTTVETTLLEQASLLSDATRCRILLSLGRQELTVSELCAVLQAPQSTVSRHLKALRDHGWIESRAQGTKHYYRSQADSASPATRRLWMLLRDEVGEERVAASDVQRLSEVLRARSVASERFFESAAGDWDSLRESLFGGLFDLHAVPAFLDESATVGDLGCGTARLTEILAPFVGKVIAVDASGPMLEAAAERLADYDNVELRQGELEDLPIADGTLDFAAIFLALHHVADPLAVLRQASRALRSGGRLVVVDMQAHDREEYQGEMGHVWLGFEQDRVTQFLASSGFESVSVRALVPVLEAKGPGLFVARATRSRGAASIAPTDNASDSATTQGVST